MKWYYFFFNFIYLWLYWVLVSVRGLSPAAASGGHSSSRCAGLSPSRPLPLRSTGSRRAGSAIVAHGPSRSAACRILPDQGPNPRPRIGRRTPNHCATREATKLIFKIKSDPEFQQSNNINYQILQVIYIFTGGK